MQVNQVKRDINDMLSSQQLGVLATYGSEYPYTNVVGFVASFPIMIHLITVDGECFFGAL